MDDVSGAWMVWSGAAETALADACQFAGEPVRFRGIALGRGAARFRVVGLGGPKVHKARNNAHDGGDVFMYRDSSIALLLGPQTQDLRCDGCSGLHCSEDLLSLRFRWIKSFQLGLCIRSLVRTFRRSGGGGDIGNVRGVTGDLHCKLIDFIHKIVVYRREEAMRGWRNWLREDPLVHSKKIGFALTWMPCDIGANHCRLRHIGWEKCGHGLTSTPREPASGSFSVPCWVCSCFFWGPLPLRYCAGMFASRIPTWCLPTDGHVSALVAEDGGRVGFVRVEHCSDAVRPGFEGGGGVHWVNGPDGGSKKKGPTKQKNSSTLCWAWIWRSSVSATRLEETQGSGASRF